MPIESATYISDLNAANPLGTDQRSTVDDHLRLIKSTVKATLPNLTGAVTPTHTELNYMGGVTSAVQTQLNAKAAKGANSDITSLSALSTPLSIAQGGTGSAGGVGNKIQSIDASVGSSALTISASALSLDFRSATLTSGTVTTVTGTPANLVISSGSTLGTVSAQKSRIAVLVLNNAGTLELAAVNLSGGVDLTETGVISTTAEGGAGASDSATVAYSTTARTGVAYRVIGYIESTQATAGTWATAPSTIQGYGGQALAALSSMGYGQTWQDVTVSRSPSTTYYNTTGRPIVVNAFINGTSGGYIYATVGGVSVIGQNANAGGVVILFHTFIVPPGNSYSVTLSAGTPTTNNWSELR